MLQKTRQQSNVPGRVPWPRPSDCLTREGKDSLLSTGSGAGDLSTHRTSDVQSGLCKDWRLIRMIQYEQSSHSEGKSWKDWTQEVERYSALVIVTNRIWNSPQPKLHSVKHFMTGVHTDTQKGEQNTHTHTSPVHIFHQTCFTKRLKWISGLKQATICSPWISWHDTLDIFSNLAHHMPLIK